MIWIFLVLVLWVGAGVVVWFLGSRGVGKDYARSVNKRVCSVGEMVRVTLRLVPPSIMIEEAPAHDVVLVIDHSNSMGSGPGSPLREALRAAENFIRWLPAPIHVGVVAFDHDAHLLCPIVEDKEQSLEALEAIGPGGSKALHAALDTAREALQTGRAGTPKTIVLLSNGNGDREPTLEALRRIKDMETPPGIISIGFGPDVDAELMQAMASQPDQYLHADSIDDLQSVFDDMAAIVSGQKALSGVITEEVWDPTPFVLSGMGQYYPIGVLPANPTRVVWAVPLMETGSVSLTYDLVAQCAGWHPVASPESMATWKVPGQPTKNYEGPAGPKVLVLPKWLRWASLVLNPLFWIIFGRFWPCQPVREAKEVVLPEPLPEPSLPALLDPLEDPLYKPKLRQALLIGLGEMGEWTLSRLKHRLWDREVEEGVHLHSVYVTHRANRVPARVGHTVLAGRESVTLHQDFRPYLETLRRDGVPSPRAWVPWRQWLTETRPQTTARAITDRRKARLALLQKPQPLEEALEAGIERVKDHDGLIIIVGAVDDDECSGLLAEVAHICAAQGASVTAVLGVNMLSQPRISGRYALADELERMVLMRGKHIVSDRHEPLVAARQLIDRIVVVEQRQETASEASAPLAELIWNMLAYDAVFKRFPFAEGQNNEAFCSQVEVTGEAFPVRGLWEWVREKTLAIEINEQWLRLQEKQGRYVLPEVDQEEVASDVKRFWTGNGLSREPSLLIVSARSLIDVNTLNPLRALVDLQAELPVDDPYHKQAFFSKAQRQQTHAYLEEWIHGILEREQANGVWGLPIVLTAVLRIEQHVMEIVASINRMAGSVDFSNLVSFSTSMYTDLLSAVSNVRSQLARWIARFTGPQIDLRVDPLGEGSIPVCYDIEQAGKAVEAGLVTSNRQTRLRLDDEFKKWEQSYGKTLLEQLRFRVMLDAESERLTFRLYLADKEIEPDDSVSEAVRAFMDRYRSITLRWSLLESVSPKRFDEHLGRFGIGKHAKQVYPQVEEILSEEDPYAMASLRVEPRLSLRDAFHVSVPIMESLPYAWPEEANASRIRQKIRNELRQEPKRFSSFAIHMLHDTHKLYGFMSEMAQHRLTKEETQYILQRNGQRYNVGPKNEALRGVAAFEEVLQYVVSLEISVDGKPLPEPSSPWTVSPEEAVPLVEAHPLAREAIGEVAWEMWQDVIRGLALEHGKA